jgi:hypothetical protein
MTDRPRVLARRLLLAAAAALLVVAAGTVLLGSGPLAAALPGGAFVLAAIATVGITLGTTGWLLDAVPTQHLGAARRPPERGRSAPVPGRDLGRAAVPAYRPPDERAAVRRRLRETAVRATAATRECSTATARDAVAGGGWTDDAVAAAFLGAVAPPRWLAAVERVSPTVAFAIGVRATLRALDGIERTDGEAGSG